MEFLQQFVDKVRLSKAKEMIQYENLIESKRSGYSCGHRYWTDYSDLSEVSGISEIPEESEAVVNMMYIVQAFKIALLVTVGLLVFVNIPTLSKIVKGEYKKMNKEMVAGKAMKWIGGFGSMLGLAFFFGAFQAYVQGFITQILPLGVVGVICLIAGVICFIMGIRKTKKAK